MMNFGGMFDKMQWQVRERMRRRLWKKHAKNKARYGRHYCDESPHGHYRLIRLPRKTQWRHS